MLVFKFRFLTYRLIGTAYKLCISTLISSVLSFFTSYHPHTTELPRKYVLYNIVVNPSHHCMQCQVGHNILFLQFNSIFPRTKFIPSLLFQDFVYSPLFYFRYILLGYVYIVKRYQTRF